MRANFNNNDDKYDPESAINMPIHSSLVMGIAPKVSFDASKEDCIKCYLFAQDLINQSRFVEAAKYNKWAFENARNLLENEQGLLESEDDELWELFFGSAYGLGFCLMEVELFTKALYYLYIAKESKNIEATMEYINCLSNSKSPLALKSIESAALDLPVPETEEQREIWENYLAFLKRRKAYVLIDIHEYGEARSFLSELLNDSKCKDFALSEINYLNALERRELSQEKEQGK